MSRASIDATLRQTQWERYAQLWKAWSTRETPPPVLLLTGTPGMGKRTLARRMIQWVQCEHSPWGQMARAQDESQDGGFGFFASEASPTALEPCEQCVSCRQHQSGNAIDCMELTPEDTGAYPSYKVDQFRDLKTRLGHGAYAHRFRAVLIPDAERMTVQAANSLLKLLEEPPRGWIFVLTSSDRSLLLPTIVSRCQFVRLAPPTESDIQGFLERQGLDGKVAQMAAARAHGSLVHAQELVQSQFQELRVAVGRFLDSPAQGMSALTEWANESEQGDTGLWNELEAQLHYRIVHAPREQTASLVARAESLFEARRLSQTPVNKKLLLQEWLAQWVRA